MTKHILDMSATASAWMPASSSRRAGFGTSFPRRSAPKEADHAAGSFSLAGSVIRQDRPSNTFGKPLKQSALLEPTASFSTTSPNASSLDGSVSVSMDSSPSATTPNGHTHEQRLLSQQVRQLNGRVVACVRQNEQVLALLEQLVALSQEIASRHNAASDFGSHPSSSASTRAPHSAGRVSATVSAASKADQTHVLRNMMEEVMAMQQRSTIMD